MAAYNPLLFIFLQSVALTGGQGNDLDLHGDTSKRDDEQCINLNGWLGCGHRRPGAVTMVFMKHGVLTPPARLS